MFNTVKDAVEGTGATHSIIFVPPFAGADALWEAYDAGDNVILSRETTRWQRELIGTRAARLTACGIAAICTKQGWTHAHVGAARL